MKKLTNELMKSLQEETKNVENYLEENKDELIIIDIKKMWAELIKKSGLTKTEIIDKSNCGYNYFYCIINGKKTPSRDKVVELIVAMGLGVDDCQTALKFSGRAPLYPRVKRDSIIIYGIENKQNIYQISEALKKNGEKILKNSGEIND